MKIKKIIYAFLIVLILFPIFSFAQISTEQIKEKEPGILEGWWNSIKIFWGKFKDVFIGALKKAWQSAVRVWQKMWEWFISIWNNYISSKIQWLWEKIIELWKKILSFFQKKKS
jgi:hypothetical protein